MYREANQVADLLAKHGASLTEPNHVFYFAPSFICNMLMADAACIVYMVTNVAVIIFCCFG